MSLLVLDELRLRYGRADDPGSALLSFPSFTLPEGGHLLLRGASGSGKSSLLALMAGLLTPTSGRLTMAGIDPAQLSAAARDAWRGAQLGFVPQRLHLSASLTVRDNLSLPYVAAGLRPDLARITAVLEALGIAGLQSRRPHALSQGQAQRVALARALLRSPRFVLADEPTANLDDEACAATLGLLRQAAEDHRLCLVIASHDARIEQAWGSWSALHRLRLGGSATVDRTGSAGVNGAVGAVSS
ncbi:ABC transporter ATP-binding protein [Roseateles amylovorans]|uniref:ATP-binding cassette domain-containing protein n=1 Tax=Roseateles amylovorans TaxID=2978473 RepID=A0ABY6B9S3_9BURK|nr:ATP-binding cassette domain-containing protein [Roseateles amylovorans]UXH80315.1 ATP-binding cassette domain-containing protein [Roseateles amylovorans]